MNVKGHAVGIGWLIALLVLVVVVIFWISGGHLSRDWVLGLFAALAIARLL